MRKKCHQKNAEKDGIKHPVIKNTHYLLTCITFFYSLHFLKNLLVSFDQYIYNEHGQESSSF